MISLCLLDDRRSGGLGEDVDVPPRLKRYFYTQPFSLSLKYWRFSPFDAIIHLHAQQKDTGKMGASISAYIMPVTQHNMQMQSTTGQARGFLVAAS